MGESLGRVLVRRQRTVTSARRTRVILAEYLDAIGCADRNRFMVLRAGSNYTAAERVTAAENLLAERKDTRG